MDVVVLLYFEEWLCANEHVQYAPPSLEGAKLTRTPPVCCGLCSVYKKLRTYTPDLFFPYS